jgi:L-ascorbate metabolism protein UlaG (beta-lactamase superfamily)
MTPQGSSEHERGPDAGRSRRDRAAFAARAARSQIRRYPRQLAAGLHPEAIRRGPFGGAGRAGDPDALEELRHHPLAAMWLGHAGVLLAIDGRLVLVDPVLSERIGVRLGPVVVGKSRLTPAPLAPADLPRPDLLLLTHAHFDHLDRPTLRALAHPRTVVITARRTRRLVPRGFGAVIELDWDDAIEREGLRIRAMRPAHWGARTVVDRRRGFNSYEVESDRRRVLLAGDTAETDAYDGLNPVELAVFGIGAYDPWIHAHASPEQVWGMFNRLGGRWLLPMHHATFQLGDEPPDEPMRRLLDAAAAAETPGDAASVLRVAPGEVWTPPPAS